MPSRMPTQRVQCVYSSGSRVLYSMAEIHAMCKCMEWNTIQEEEARSTPNIASQILSETLEHGWSIISGELPAWLRSLRIFDSNKIVNFLMESGNVDFKRVMR